MKQFINKLIASYNVLLNGNTFVLPVLTMGFIFFGLYLISLVSSTIAIVLALAIILGIGISVVYKMFVKGKADKQNPNT